MSPSDDDINAVTRWRSRMRRLAALLKSQGADKAVAWFVVPKVRTLFRKWNAWNDGLKEMERKEREKHGWKEGDAPSDPWRPS